ncbi:MAG: DNA double-strand break repair nuclease NurA [Nanoarchaeota archaeon]
MYDEIAKKILESLNENLISEDHPKFSGEGYKANKIDIKNFHEIKGMTSGNKIAFVDGGSAEILGSANFSLNLLRVCCVIYQNNKKVQFRKFEFFAFVRAVIENDEIHYKASFFNAKNAFEIDEISFNSFDRTLMHGNNRAEIGNVANALRRYAELKLARQMADEKLCSIIVLDGNLQCCLTNEGNYLNELYNSCSRNNIILSALSKKSSVFTDTGNLLSVVLSRVCSLPSWFYYPIVEIKNTNHKAEMFFVKFHSKSRHVFRFEIFNAQKARAEEIIITLAGNCIDPIFIGYPYGLVEADKIARVSNHEKNLLRTIFLVKLKDKNIEQYLSSINAHEILDRISF